MTHTYLRDTGKISSHQVHQETFHENSYLVRFGGHGWRRRF